MNPTPRLDRLIPLLTLILVGFGIIFLLDAGPIRAVFNLGGGLPKMPVVWPLVILVSLLAGVGAEFLLRGHRGFQRRLVTPVQVGPFDADLLLPLWIQPALTPIATFAFFRLFIAQVGGLAYLAVLVTTGVLLVLIYTMQHSLLLGTPAQQALARISQSIVGYGLAFGIFAAVVFNTSRTLYAACLLLPVVLLLAYDMLRDQLQHPWRLALLLALVLGASYWALGFWPAPFLIHAAALLLIFYSAIGCLQHASEQGIPRHVLIEYGLIMVGGLLLLGIAAYVLSAPAQL